MIKPVLAVFLLAFAAGCHSTAGKPAPAPLFAVDSSKAQPEPGNTSAAIGPRELKSHLKDTTIASGNFILFLEPDQERFDKEANDSTNEGMYESDGDFAVGIANTIDSVKTGKHYKSVKVLTSTSRYILIKDCKDGPIIIDRDMVDYGYILSGKGKSITKEFNSVHSGDYLDAISGYFGLPAPERDL